MKKFLYQARNQEGKKIKGMVEAVGAKEAVLALRQRKLIVVELSEIGVNLIYRLRVLISRVSFVDVVKFTRQFATMINAGLPITQSLSILQDQASPAMSKVVAEVLQDVQAGTSLTKALEKHPRVFSPVYLALIRSGEAAGVMDDVLKKLADNLEKQQEFRSKVKGSMIYPAIILVGMVVVVIIMMVFVIPKMLDMYKEFGAELPASTQLLISLVETFQKYWYFMLAAIAGIVYGLRMWYKTDAGREKIDRFLLRIPIVGILQQKVILSDVTRTLGMLVGAGVSIIESLEIVSMTANNVIYEKALRKTAKSVEKGLPLGATIGRHRFFPPIVAQMIAVGEETGKLDEVLLRVSRYFENESEEALKALTTAIEPLMMIMLGVGVGFLVIAIILPIYNLTASF